MTATTERARRIPGERFPCWDHQLEAFEHVRKCFMSRERSAYLAMKMGTGKTKVVVDVVSSMARRRPLRVLVLCPKAVVPVWPAQFELHGHDDVDFTVVAPTKSTTAKRAQQVQTALNDSQREQHATVVVLNYDAARCAAFGYTKGNRTKRGKKGLLLQTQWDLVVLDESHRAKRQSGPTKLLVQKLFDCSRYRLCLSGTPWPQGPVDAWSQFLFLHPRILGESFVEHRRKYCVLGGPTNTWIRGTKNLDLFADSVRDVVYECDDSVVDLPELNTIDLSFDMNAEELRRYADMRDDLVTYVRDEEFRASNALVKILRLAQIASGFLSEDDVVSTFGSSREERLADWLHDVDRTEPVVVFYRFKQQREQVLRLLRARGPESNGIDEICGGENTVGSKWGGNKSSVAVQIQSGNMGIDLTKARFAVFYSPTYNLAEYEQAVKRIHRPGQGKPCTVVQLVADGSVDRDTYDALAQKKSVVEYIAQKLRDGDE